MTKVQQLQQLADKIYGEGVAKVEHYNCRYELTTADSTQDLGTFDEAHDTLSQKLPEDSGEYFAEDY